MGKHPVPGEERTFRWVIVAVVVPIAAAVVGSIAAVWLQRQDSAAPKETRSLAAAQPGSAMDRCRRNAGPDEEGTTTFAGTDADAVYPRTPRGAQAPNAIHPGDVIRIEASGSIYFGVIGVWVEPPGTGAAAPADWAFPGSPQYGAIVRYNNHPTGWMDGGLPVGQLAACTTFSGDKDVRQAFLMNTNADHAGNTGAWSFHVRVYRD